MAMATQRYIWPPPTSTTAQQSCCCAWEPTLTPRQGLAMHCRALWSMVCVLLTQVQCHSTAPGYLSGQHAVCGTPAVSWSTHQLSGVLGTDSIGHRHSQRSAGDHAKSPESWSRPWLAPSLSFLTQLSHHISEICDYQHGQTPLHIACASKDEARVLVLLDAGCNVQATDGQGRTPLGVALLNRFYRAVPMLLEYGARLSETERASAGLPLLKHLDRTMGEGSCDVM